MAAPTEEALSFISKFMHLGQMGLDASLQFTSSYGRIYADFYANFGYVQDPTILLQQPFIQKSYQPRRRVRHKRPKKVIKDKEVASRNVEFESQNVDAYDSNSIEEEAVLDGLRLFLSIFRLDILYQVFFHSYHSLIN